MSVFPSRDAASGSSSSSGAPRKDGVVKKERLSKIAGGGRYRINNQYDKKHSRRPREEIVEEAEKKVGKQVDYDLLKSNCEHFATRLGYGVADSEQVRRQPPPCACHQRLLQVEVPSWREKHPGRLSRDTPGEATLQISELPRGSQGKHGIPFSPVLYSEVRH